MDKRNDMRRCKAKDDRSFYKGDVYMYNFAGYGENFYEIVEKTAKIANRSLKKFVSHGK